MQPAETCVISVNYHGSKDTAACVRSLLGSIAPVTVIVVDTTPNDPELRPALQFAPGVTFLDADDNIGFGRANNLGIEWALSNTNCEFLLLLNNDAIVLPHSIHHLQTAMDFCPEVGIMAPRVASLHNPDLLWYGGGEIDWRRASAVVPGFGKAADAPLAMTERDVTFASGCALFMRRSAAAMLGGFDPRFFMYEEDVELCLRARQQAIRIRYVPRSLILHRAQGSSRTHGNAYQHFWSCTNPRLAFYAYHSMRNRALNITLHAHGWQRLVAVVCFPILLLRRAVPFFIGRRPDAVMAMLRGVRDALHTQVENYL